MSDDADKAADLVDLPDDHLQTEATAELLARDGRSLVDLLDNPDTTIESSINGRIDELSDTELAGGSQQITMVAEPVANLKHDAMLKAIVDGVDKGLAYHRHVSNQCSRRSAVETACKLVNQPEYQGRLKWLIEEKRRLAGYGPVGGSPAARGESTLEDVLQLYDEEMHSAGASHADKISAAKAFEALKKIIDARGDSSGLSVYELDPAVLCDYFTRAHNQGRSVEDEARTIVSERDGDKAEAGPSAADLSDSEGTEAQDVVEGAESDSPTLPNPPPNV